MNLRTLILIENACFKARKTMAPKGIMVHSTGVNNPRLMRYVGPDDGLLGKNISTSVFSNFSRAIMYRTVRNIK